MARLYMIRHGKPSAVWGQNPDPDPGLDETGQAQARAAAEALMALPADQRPTRVLSSPLRRCRETAQPYADAIGVPVEIEARFGEIPSPSALAQEERGPWLRNAFQSQWSEVKGDIDYGRWRDAVGEALGELDANTAVFSHFVAINAGLSCVTGETRVLTFRPDHASITVFEARDGKVSLVERGPEAATQVL
ncbi:MAG TPA: histidine phosphatase family protein [Caulobacteraceae bacterium]|jgi:broad specificity phosphatase PhoE|nr:histidine phosphatase family protein [Caulobacteraceae bacterium]